MRLNSFGEACHGLVTLAVNGTAPDPNMRSTAPDWLTQNETIQQVRYDDVHDRWNLQRFDVRTNKVNKVDDLPATIVAASGAGTWAAQTSGGVRSNLHPFVKEAGLRGVGRDGTLGYCHSQQDNEGLVLRQLSGTEREVFKGLPMLDCHVVSFDTACWTRGYRLFTFGAPTPKTVDEPVFEPRLFMVGDAWWVLYHTQNRLVTHPVDQPIGYVVEEKNDTFAPDAMLMGANIRIVWSITQGEGPSAFRARNISLTQARVDLRKPIVPPVTPDPPKVTITEWQPHIGPAPLKSRAVRALSGGPATTLMWRYRPLGQHGWLIAATNPASDPDHTFVFSERGVYEIGVDVLGPGGTDGTTASRQVQAV